MLTGIFLTLKIRVVPTFFTNPLISPELSVLMLTDNIMLSKNRYPTRFYLVTCYQISFLNVIGGHKYLAKETKLTC
jgi:hypothetical protein